MDMFKRRLARSGEAKPKRRIRRLVVAALPSPPEGSRYPREGDVYEAIIDGPITYMTHYFDLPYTGGGDAVLPKGERVRVGHVRDAKPLGVYCDPLRYDELHETIVAADERANKLYRGYYLAIDTVALITSFKLIRGDAAGARPNATMDRPGGTLPEVCKLGQRRAGQ